MNITSQLRSLFITGLLILPVTAQIKVASLNPILTDLLTQIGGEKVTVIKVVKGSSDVHNFQPKTKDLKSMQDCRAIFAMGKGLETYLPAIQETLQSGQVLIDIGRSIPSQKVDADPIYTCCPHHDKNAVDPHWWHNVQNMERAAKVVYKELSKLDPENKGYYKQKGDETRKNYRNLHNWVKGQVAQIEKKHRVLVTSHAAFAYFCKEYGFEAAYVQGLSKEGEISAQHLSQTIITLKERGIRAVFQEIGANPKVLGQIAKESGTTLGKPLYADHMLATYQETVLHNVNTIVKALR